MPKKITSLFILAVFTASFVFAAPAKEPTGYDYLAMKKAARAKVVSLLIQDAKTGGVTIKQGPVTYCKKLDAFYQKNPNMKKEPLAVVLKTLVIMEYDWDQKGVDKDALARQWLGEKICAENKARLGNRGN